MEKANIDIYYCRQCNWMLRATWLSQELLSTFSDELNQVSLHPDTGGHFEIFCNGAIHLGTKTRPRISRSKSSKTAS